MVEVVKSYHKRGRGDRVLEFLAMLSAEEVLRLVLPAAEHAGRVYAGLEISGQPIGRIDPPIAGVALHHGLTMVTGNTAHYERIQALGYSLKPDKWRC